MLLLIRFICAFGIGACLGQAPIEYTMFGIISFLIYHMAFYKEYVWDKE